MEKHDRALVSGMVIAVLEIWIAWLVFIVLIEMGNTPAEVWNAYGISAIATVILTMLATLFLYTDHTTSWGRELRDRARDTARDIVETQHRKVVKNEVESTISSKMFDTVVRRELDDAVDLAVKKLDLRRR